MVRRGARADARRGWRDLQQQHHARGLSSILVDTLRVRFLKVWSAQCLNLSIVTRARAPR
jgi:hypothetical protein